MGYFNNFDNEFLNKSEKNLKNRTILWICSSTYRLMLIQISYNFIIVCTPSQFYTICNGYNLTVFDELSNDNKIK
jgi:hypothetical protein